MKRSLAFGDYEHNDSREAKLNVIYANEYKNCIVLVKNHHIVKDIFDALSKTKLTSEVM